MNLEKTLGKEYGDITANKIADVNYTNTSKKIIQFYDDFIAENDFLKESSVGYNYSKSILLDSQIEYTQEDITAVSFELSRRADEKWDGCGIFLSVLIQNHYKKKKTETPYVLLQNPFEPITERTSSFSRIGFQNNGPTIHIYGNCKNYVGEEMLSGTIVIFGNTNATCGYRLQGGTIHIEGSAGIHLGVLMEKGSIIVKENAADFVGGKMSGGKILIEKNAERYIGKEMSGGTIHIKGDAEKYIGREMTGGEIIIDGSCKSEVGYQMKNGKIIIGKDAGNEIGHATIGGEITIYGTARGVIGRRIRGGTIFLEDETAEVSIEQFPNSEGKIYCTGKQIFPEEK